MELRCAPWAVAESVDPVGTAGSYRGFCCVEWPRPWPRDIGEAPELAVLAAEATARGVRLQALLPAPERGAARVVLYRHSGDGFVRYRGTEAECPPEEVVEAALALLEGRGGHAVPAPHDVLICGHGRRDVCCGTRGTELAAALEGALGGGARVWRTSHTGGHRFAATGIVLPEGTLWARLDADLVARVVGRRGPVADVLPHYRGCAGLGPPVVQALERAVLGEVGWDLFDCRRTGRDLGGGRVRLEVEAPGAAVQAWEADVEVSRLLPIPECGQPISAARKTEAELVVKGLRVATGS